MGSSVDAVICSKDRFPLLCKAIEQVKRLVPAERVVIVESSERPFVDELKSLGVDVVLTPGVKLGAARQAGLVNSSSDLVFFVDDDIKLEPDVYPRMLKTLESKENVVAVSGRVVYGWQSDPVLFKLFRRGRPPREGGSGGFALMKRNAVLGVGGYNPSTHWGEDMELCSKLERKGLKWVRELEAVGYHKLTLRKSLGQAWRNGVGCTILWKHAEKRLFPVLSRIVARTFVMPVYYALQTREPRIIVYYFLYNLVYLAGFLTGLK